jgi:hypothetical protein
MLKSGIEIAELTKRNNTFKETATEQNCFKFERTDYKEANGLSIDVPIPSIFIETHISKIWYMYKYIRLTMSVLPTQPLTEMSTRNLPGVREQQAYKAENLTAICLKIWQP